MKKLIIFLMLIGFFSVRVYAEGEYAKGGKTACLYETKTNTILFAKEENFRLAPASMTKIMTLILIFEELEKNTFSLTDMVTTSENAASFGGSQVYLEVNEKLSVDDMLKCICISSANDCAVAMAEFVAGSETEFVNRMNAKAANLGLKNTNFVDCTGLSAKNHYSSALDMAIMADYLVEKYPKCLEYTNIREDYIRKDTDSPFWLVNTNKLIGIVKGVDGVKTGWTVEAGYCITLSMNQNGMRLISVVMGYSDSKLRNKEAFELLNYGFANYSLDLIYQKGLNIISYETILYKPTKITFSLDSDIYVLKKRGAKLADFSYVINEEPNLNNRTNGSVTIIYDNKEYAHVSLISDCDFKKKNFFELVKDLFKKSFH